MSDAPNRSERSFRVDDTEWTARIAGESAAGTGGGSGHAYLVAIQFSRRGEPRPSHEAFLPRGRFQLLFDDELRDLLRTARPLEPPDERAG